MIEQITNGFICVCDSGVCGMRKFYIKNEDTAALHMSKWGWGSIGKEPNVNHYCSEACREAIKSHRKAKRNALAGQRAAASLQEKYKGTGGVEIIRCPVCLGKLLVTVAKRSGKTSGRCQSTVGCVQWLDAVIDTSNNNQGATVTPENG